MNHRWSSFARTQTVARKPTPPAAAFINVLRIRFAESLVHEFRALRRSANDARHLRALSQRAEQHGRACVRRCRPASIRRCGAAWRNSARSRLRVPEEAGGMGLGLLDAAILMEEVGRTLASGPIAETLVAARLLATLDPGATQRAARTRDSQVRPSSPSRCTTLRRSPCSGLQAAPSPRLSSRARAIDIVLVTIPESERKGEPNLASTPIAELRLGGGASMQCCPAPMRVARAFAQAHRGMEAADCGRARRAVARVGPPCRRVCLRACRLRSADRHLSGDLASARRSQHRCRRRQVPDLESDSRYRRRRSRRRAPRSRWRRGGTSIPRDAPSRRRCTRSAVTA